MKKKNPKGSDSGYTAVFDFAARREFITGASKRKEQRRQEAQARALEKQKEERRLLRAQRREKIREQINYVKRSQQLAEAAAEAITLRHKKRQKSVGADSQESRASDSSPATKREGHAAEKAWKASEAQPAKTSEVVQAVRLLPPPTNDVSSSPWHIASCVSLSIGGFVEAPAAAAATGAPAARVHKPLQAPSEASVSSEEKQLQTARTSVTPQETAKIFTSG
ncbi:uncharacterized protein EMH_0020180 [Eimeria mitis]|uniref:Uncharacterized protein n=1 Tax=Eimeria mitis TaxID=44415 RepID=U6K906_9EIME|nr:uncharacterized protein EMH_0020180 [Eimeria mitis]CDJ34414.1 hypothetical protein, conserved [Eimeria mitis]